MNESMTPKERWLAAIRMEPVDRLPFWPKLNASYPRAQEGSFQGMDLRALHEWIGSDKHTGLANCFAEHRKHTAVETSTQDGMMRTVYKTPHGEIDLVRRFDETSQSWHPVKFPVQTAEDIKIMTAVYRDVTVDLHREQLEQAKGGARRLGQDSLATNGIGESPLMHWVEWLAGIENAHYLLHDETDLVEELFREIHRVLLRRTEILAEYSPVDLFYLVENTSTTLISPEQYRKYCSRHILEYAEITQAFGRNLALHMCGHLKAILPDLAQLPVHAFEAFTSPTLGNTTLLDGRSQCPDKCLIGGTNAMLWLRSHEEIIAQIEKDLDALPHHRGIVVTSAGVMPPLCPPETIRRVCAWVKEYPANMN